jgi:hypothetical protein
MSPDGMVRMDTQKNHTAVEEVGCPYRSLNRAEELVFWIYKRPGRIQHNR